jgi:pyrroloquinoline-quinone synthase
VRDDFKTKFEKKILTIKFQVMQRLFPPVFEQYNLLQHPFYLAWNGGRLTKEQMAVYATGYGSFIQLISKGWQAAGEQTIAKEEEEHYVLWKNFAESLGTKHRGANISQVNELVSSVKNCFGSYAGALGALYAFEAQQPATATSKLEGLKKHYSSWLADETYFTIHQADLEEPALLEEKINLLSKEEKLVAALACEKTCNLLWDALTGIMEHTGVHCLN